MQIHELTQLKELGLGNILDLGDAIGKGSYLFKPGAKAMTSTRGYADAMRQYHLDKLGAADAERNTELQQQTQKKAQELTQQWIQQVKALPTASAAPAAPGTAEAEPDTNVAARTPNWEVMPPEPKGTVPAGRRLGNRGNVVDADYTDVTPVDANRRLAGPQLTGTRPQPRLPSRTMEDLEAMLEEALRNPGYHRRQAQRRTATPAAAPAASTPAAPAAPAEAQQFENWLNQQLTQQVSGTNQTINLSTVLQDTETKQKLAALLPGVQQHDARAVYRYIMIAMTAMQSLAQQTRRHQTSDIGTVAYGSLDRIMRPNQIEALKQLAQDPYRRREIEQVLGLRK